MLRIHKQVQESYTDGPDGPRHVIWLQGCSIRCPGCQNKELWSSEAKTMLITTGHNLARHLWTTTKNPLTITGGEPFDQVGGLAQFLHDIKQLDPDRHITVYTGYTWEHLHDTIRRAETLKVKPTTRAALYYIDVLVDGPYDPELDDDYMQWRGSSNQRVIDVQASLAADPDGGAIVTLDWDTPAIEIDNGTLYATGGLIEDLDLAEAGEAGDVPRCGQAIGR